jgi:hypothetical protein
MIHRVVEEEESDDLRGLAQSWGVECLLERGHVVVVAGLGGRSSFDLGLEGVGELLIGDDDVDVGVVGCGEASDSGAEGARVFGVV